MSASPPTTDKVDFPTCVSPIGIYFAVVASLIIVFAASTFLTTKLPIVLMLLLVTVVACCFALLKTAIDEMGAVTIEWSNQGVTVRRLMGSVSYYWSHVERVDLYDPGATFGDNGRHAENRSAIGLFIRDPAKPNRPSGDLPDLMLISRVGDAAEKIPKLSERLSNSKRYGGGRDGRKIGSAAQRSAAPAAPAKARSSKQFRRSAASKVA